MSDGSLFSIDEGEDLSSSKTCNEFANDWSDDATASQVGALGTLHTTTKSDELVFASHRKLSRLRKGGTRLHSIKCCVILG